MGRGIGGGPHGFVYRAAFVTPEDERALVHDVARLAFTELRMRGQVARRRTAHFGWLYGYESGRIEPGPLLPEFLLPLRERAAALAGLAPDELSETLVTEYRAGAGIGWHLDAPMFGDVVGISLLGACRMRFRRVSEPCGGGYRSSLEPARRTPRYTAAVVIAPRSAYLLRGSARWQWRHSIPPVAVARYSITFRTLRGAPPTGGPRGVSC